MEHGFLSQNSLFLSSDQEKLFSQSVVLPEKNFQAAEKCVVT